MFGLVPEVECHVAMPAVGLRRPSPVVAAPAKTAAVQDGHRPVQLAGMIAANILRGRYDHGALRFCCCVVACPWQGRSRAAAGGVSDHGCQRPLAVHIRAAIIVAMISWLLLSKERGPSNDQGRHFLAVDVMNYGSSTVQ